MPTPQEQLESMIANFKAKTGKTLDQWAAIARKSGLAKHGEIVAMLKGEHAMGHGYANVVAQRTLQAGAGEPAGDGLIDAQYAGAKAGLRPIYDAIIGKVRTFGGDVEVAPKKTYVSLRRSKQFALVQPSTGTRVDVGINLKGKAPGGRLEASGSFNSMVSHRVRVEKAGDVDAELVAWLREAYNAG